MTASQKIIAAAHELAARYEADGFSAQDAREMATAMTWAGIVAADPNAARQIMTQFNGRGR